MKHKKTFLLIVPLIFALCLGALFFLTHTNKDARRFRQASDDFFTGSLEKDSLSLHYTLADPSPYLEAPSPASLPVYSEEGHRENAALFQRLLTALQETDPEKLKGFDRYTYELLLPYAENELAGARLSYFEEPLSPSSGMHMELPVLLAEYTFRTGQDVQDYLDILESVPAYMEGLVRYEKEKAAAGLFMPQKDAALVVEQCDQIMDPVLLEQDEHFLQATFQERVDELIRSGGLPAQDRDYLLSENNRLLRTVVSPAYVALADQIFLLSGSEGLSGGVCQAKGGTAYYTYLLRRNTGSARTPEEMKELLSLALQEQYGQLQSLTAQYRQQTGRLPEAGMNFSDFPLQDAQEILADLQQRMKEDFPPLERLSGELPACTTKAVSSAMEPYTSPAFYLTPPMDDVTKNVIYVNHSSTPPGLELYTTLAHEGYPGHLYQTIYSQLWENSRTDNPVRNVLYYGGFVEGWAYYVENLSYGYAADLLAEHGAAESQRLLVQIARLERNLQVNLYCLLDLAIHYYGASMEEACQSLAAFGISDPDTAEAIYDYIRREPTTYLKYYVGYLEILELRRQAENAWGGKFSPLRFHTFLLQAGPSDFENLGKLLGRTGG